MMQTVSLSRRRFELMAAEFLARMGERIRERREELGLSRAEVARRMPGKVSENQIYRWEKGLHQPNPVTLDALAKVLEREVSQLMAPPPDKSATPEPFGDSQLDRIEHRLDDIYLLLTSGEGSVVADVIARLIEAAGSRHPPTAGQSQNPPVAARRKSA